MMTRKLYLVSLFAALLAGMTACAEEDPAGRIHAALAAGDSHDGLPVDDSETDGLPACSTLDLGGLDVVIHPVTESGGLYAAEVDGDLVCIDDLDGLRKAGVPEAQLPAMDVPPTPADGNPLPASPTSKPTDGNPLPADGSGGTTNPETLVTDGNPLPAAR